LALRLILRYCSKIAFVGELKMELAVVTIVILVGASLIPGDYHVVFFR
jgi:hypothetical protein